ncbi:MAG TPA: hypothetical protein VL326_18170 [Kofleriaceae bacterium]|nr:hypothetical protein [Kofleriaceae bacterium]
MVALMLFQMVFFVQSPPPDFYPTQAAALDWFSLFERRPLLALLHLDGLMLVDYVLVLVLYSALWVALRRSRPVITLVAFVMTAVAAATYFSSNPAFTMLALADQYSVATTDAARSQLLAAAQATLAVYHGTPFDVAYVLSAIGGLLMCVAMLGTGAIGRKTAYVGIVTYAMNLVPATAGTIGLVLSTASLLPLAVWLVLVAIALFKLRR